MRLLGLGATSTAALAATVILGLSIYVSAVRNGTDMFTVAQKTFYWVAGRDRFNEVLPGLYLGDEIPFKSAEEYAQSGLKDIQLVVRCKPGTFRADLFPHVRLHQVSIPDVHTADIIPFLDTAANAIDEYLSDGQKVYVHCTAGKSRSTTVVIAYLMLKRKMSLLSAAQLVKEKRPVVSPNSGFLRQLVKFERKTNSEASASPLDEETQLKELKKVLKG